MKKIKMIQKEKPIILLLHLNVVFNTGLSTGRW